MAAESQSTLLAAPGASRRTDASTTFIPSMGEPVHRWFRYSAGFSATWAMSLIAQAAAERGAPPRVLDPFCGSGTALLAAQAAGAPSLGVEHQPFVARIAAAKLRWSSSPDDFEERAREVLAAAAARPVRDPAPLLDKCYSRAALARLNGVAAAVAASADGSPADELAWLALAAAVRPSSHAGTAQWQYVLPGRQKARVADPVDAFAGQCALMAADMRELARPGVPPEASVLHEDARTCAGVPDGWADLVVTSPPYANNYDYADATRLEMTALGEVRGWGDLKPIRDRLIRSCSQQMSGYDIAAALAAPALDPIRADLEPVVARLTEVKAARSGHKAYDAMVVAYFTDLADVWSALRRCCAPGARVCFVVGDSAPYGVHVPVEEWLGRLAVAAGFRSWSFEKARDRNVKWRNRKHRVPLHEGRLWVEG
jgi:SAM-dependent methyltransferase